MSWTVRGWNAFYEGWLAYLLGEPRPSAPIAADGWDMAADTPSFDHVVAVIGKERELGHVVVTASDVDSHRDSNGTEAERAESGQE